MARRQRHQARHDAVDTWRAAQAHQWDLDYYGRTGRQNPRLHAHVGFMLAACGGVGLVLGLSSVLVTGLLPLLLLGGSGALLAVGVGMLRWKARRTRAQARLQSKGRSHRRRQPH